MLSWPTGGGLGGTMTSDSETAQLRELAERYRPLLEHGPVGLFEVHRDGTIRYCNDALARSAGYASAKEMIGTNIGRHYVDPRRREELWRELALKGSVTDFAVAVKTTTGEERQLILSLTDMGEVAHGLSVDVTELYAKEHALESALELNRSILEAMPGGVVHVRVDGSIATANSEALRVLGLAFDELTRRYTVDFETETIHEDGTPCSNEHYPVTQALVTGQTQPPHTIGVRRPDGEISWAVFRAVPVLDPASNAVTGAVVTFIDISERKRAERALQQAQKLESLGLMAGGVAHDFNNLLAAIMGHAGLVRLRLGDRPDVAEHLAELEAAVNRAADLTRQMLAYAGRGHVRSAPVDLNRVVREVVGLISSVISKKAELHLDLADSLPATEADPSQLHQVLMNLVLNASDALGRDPGLIRIRTAVSDLSSAELARTYVDDELSAGRYVVLEVGDTGSGMDAGTRLCVFDPFFTTKSAGRGLGLAATLGIVRSHRGAMDVESALGKGTTFRVFLPASAHAPAVVPGPQPLPPAGQGTVLVVDDDAGVLRTTCTLLEQLGYSVLPSENGRDAHRLMSEHVHEVEVVVLDLTMPDSSGGEVLPDLLRLRPDVGVVLVSGYSEEDVQGLLAESPNVHFLQKPFTPAALVASIERVRERRGGSTAE